MLSTGFAYDDVIIADAAIIEDGLDELIDTVVAVVGDLDVLVDVVASVGSIEGGPGEVIGAVSAVVGAIDAVVVDVDDDDVAASRDELNDIIADVVTPVGGPVDSDNVGVPSRPYPSCRSRKYSR